MSENENDFYVDEYGEIHRKDAPQRLENDALWQEYQNDALWQEYQQLEYEIFSHGEKSPEKLARFQELEKQLGISEKKKNAFLNAKNKLRAQQSQTMSITQILSMGNENQND